MNPSTALRAAVAAAALLASQWAAALSVVVDNGTEATVSMAFSYLDAKSKKWMVDGWYNISPNEKSRVELNTSNELYYVYAEFSNGKKISGGTGSADLKVKETNFLYPQDKDLPDASRTVSFLRARSSNNQATINVR